MLSRLLLPLAALLLLASTSVSAGYCTMGVYSRVGACGRFVDVDLGRHAREGTRPHIVCPLDHLNKPDHIHAWVVIGDRHTGDFSINSQVFPYTNHGTQELAILERGSKISVKFENKHTDITACKDVHPQRLPMFCESCSVAFEVDIVFEGDMIQAPPATAATTGAGVTSFLVAKVVDHLPGAPSPCDQPVKAKIWTCGGRTFTFNTAESGTEVTIRCPRRFINTLSPLTASLSNEWITNLIGHHGVFRINHAKFRKSNRGGVIVRLREGMEVKLRFRTHNQGDQGDSKCNSAKLDVRVVFEDSPAPTTTTTSGTGSGSDSASGTGSGSGSGSTTGCASGSASGSAGPVPTSGGVTDTDGQDSDTPEVSEDPLGVPTGSYGEPQLGDWTSTGSSWRPPPSSGASDAGADQDPPSDSTSPTTSTSGTTCGSPPATGTGAGTAAKSSTGAAAGSGPLTPKPTPTTTTQNPLPVTVIHRPSSSTGVAGLAEGANAAPSKHTAFGLATVIAVVAGILVAA